MHPFSIHGSAAHAVRTHGRLPRALNSAALILAIATLAACKPEQKPVVVVETTPPANTDTAVAPAPAAIPPQTAATGAAVFIGTTVPPYPQDFEQASGHCVAGGEGLEHACDFSLATIGNRTASGEISARYLIASRNIDMGAKQPQWQVTDAVDVPDIDTGYDLQIAGCRLNGADVPGLVAVVRYTDAEFLSDVTWVRRYDTVTGKLSDIPADGVDCANLSAGV